MHCPSRTRPDLTGLSMMVVGSSSSCTRVLAFIAFIARERQALIDRSRAPDIVARLGHVLEAFDHGCEDVADDPSDVGVAQEVVASVKPGEVDHARELLYPLLFFELTVEHARREGEVAEVARNRRYGWVFDAGFGLCETWNYAI